MTEEKQRFAVTYQRFSSVRQVGNSSLDRQTDTQKAWLRQNPNVTVIDNFVDKAMSGWSGKHLKEGSLGQLMKAIEDGIIQPGTLILVEHFSRLTRQNIDNAEELVKRIWKAGITLVTVSRQYRVSTRGSK
nr:recombinase family protein [Vibrio cidicii]